MAFNFEMDEVMRYLTSCAISRKMATYSEASRLLKVDFSRENNRKLFQRAIAAYEKRNGTIWEPEPGIGYYPLTKEQGANYTKSHHEKKLVSANSKARERLSRLSPDDLNRFDKSTVENVAIAVTRIVRTEEITSSEYTQKMLEEVRQNHKTGFAGTESLRRAAIALLDVS